MDIIFFLKQPLFWIITSFTSVALSVLANLITPKISRIVAKFSDHREEVYLHAQKYLRHNVIMYQNNQNKVLSAKLDAIYWVLRSVLIFALGLLIIAIISRLSGPHEEPLMDSIMVFVFPALIIALSGQWLIKAKKTISIAFLAEERQRALEKYKLEANRELSQNEISQFFASWDYAKFGVEDDSQFIGVN